MVNSPSITVLCATLGRSFLPVTIASFVLNAAKEDRLILLGDGVECPLDELPANVEWRTRSKRGNWGHDHLLEAMNDGVPGDYLALTGDDDVFMPYAFTTVRPFLADASGMMVFYPVFGNAGQVRRYAFANFPIYMPGLKMAAQCEGLRAFFPNEGPFSRFGAKMDSDGAFLRLEVAKHGGCVMPLPLAVTRASDVNEAVWGALGLRAIAPWSEEYAGARG